MNRTKKIWAAGATALALAVGAGIAVPAYAADITGEVEVTLDFSTPNATEVSVYTKNTSAVTAYGRAEVTRNGDTAYFSEKRFAPGEVWTWEKTLRGYDCSDLITVSAEAFGSETRRGSADWTSGVLTAADPRVTVIGCDTPTPTPSPTPTAQPTATPTAQPTATPTAEPTAQPTTAPPAQPTTAPTTPPSPTATATASPSASPAATAAGVAAGSGNGQSGKGSLAVTGMSGASLLPIALIAVGVLVAGAVILMLRRRRSA